MLFEYTFHCISRLSSIQFNLITLSHQARDGVPLRTSILEGFLSCALRTAISTCHHLAGNTQIEVHYGFFQQRIYSNAKITQV